jgi:hypothetical protein
MKKITLLLAFIGIITLQGCTVNEVQDTVDNDTIAEVFELKNVNFSFDNTSGKYFIYRNLNPQIYASDNILIYRMSDVINSSTPVWQLIPRTLYLNSGELDYDYDSVLISCGAYSCILANLIHTNLKKDGDYMIENRIEKKCKELMSYLEQDILVKSMNEIEKFKKEEEMKWNEPITPKGKIIMGLIALIIWLILLYLDYKYHWRCALIPGCGQ